MIADGSGHLGVSRAPSLFLIMKVNEMGDGEKPLRKEGNAEFIHGLQVNRYENCERLLVLGSYPLGAEYSFIGCELVFCVVPGVFHPGVLCSDLFPYFLP